LLPLALAAMLAAAGCVSVNYTDTLTGQAGIAALSGKRYTAVRVITVYSTEVHHAGPLGLVKRIEGGKVTFSDLMLEARDAQADDIINVRIDQHTGAKTTFMDWLTGWNRTVTYTGTALAIRYLNDDEIGDGEVDPSLFRR
jgi:uncharacterized protein YbjQ (UPF0145 family)